MKNVLKETYKALGVPIDVAKWDEANKLVKERFVGKYVYGIDGKGIVKYGSMVVRVEATPNNHSYMLELGTGDNVIYHEDKDELVGVRGTRKWGHLLLREEETEAMKYWRSIDVEGSHIVGKDSYGHIQYKETIDNYTAYYHHNGKTGEIKECLNLQLNDGKKMKWDILSDVFIPQWECEQELKFEIVPLKETSAL